VPQADDGSAPPDGWCGPGRLPLGHSGRVCWGRRINARLQACILHQIVSQSESAACPCSDKERSFCLDFVATRRPVSMGAPTCTCRACLRGFTHGHGPLRACRRAVQRHNSRP
jgi:hypothetical protein